MSASRGRICFYSERAYLVLDPSIEPFAGGAEVLSMLLARGLVKQGFEVSVVTCDFGQPRELEIDGIRVHRSFARERGLPVLRFFHPRLTGAIGALLRADAEVYYIHGSGLASGVAYDAAWLKGAAFVLHQMSDYDVGKDLSRLGVRDRLWYRAALHGADHVYAQTEFQRTALRENHRVESTVLPNLIEIPPVAIDPGHDGHVLWLGTYKEIKRPEWFLRLAQALPRYHFIMVGVVPPPPLTREHWEAAVAAARDCPNLEVRGFQPHEEIGRLMEEAALLVHTSPTEGFSNVMLEAWAMGLPSVSSVNPDGVVTRLGLGAVATDFPYLVETVDRLMGDPRARREAGAHARRYVEQQHHPDVVLGQLGRDLDRLVAGVRARRGR